MQTIIICLVLLAIAVVAVLHYQKTLRSGCCGGDSARVKRVRVADRDKSHYSYAITLFIDGMTCQNCARRVENTLNALSGVWATVDYNAGTAQVLLKQKLSEDLLRAAVQSAGFTMLRCCETAR